jgi:putative oxidoreductase
MDWIFGNYVQGRGAAGLLIVRLVFGLGIMLHGWQKIQSPGGPMGWMNPPPAASDAKESDKKPASKAPVPGIFQGLATMAEFSGGLGIIVGLLTPIAAFGLVCNMLVAVFMVHVASGHAFVGGHGQPSSESAAGYLAVALLLLLTGPGELSLDALWVKKLYGKEARSWNMPAAF